MLFRPLVRRNRHSENGYVLLTLILFVALLAIAAAVTAPLLSFQLKRDREQELIHRGTQYARAIQHYVKKFGSYPTSLEALENTNQVRFLRRRYKDPITGKDFKLLHAGEVQMSFGAGIPGANTVNALAQGQGQGPGGLNAGGFGNNGGFGAQPGGPGGIGNGGVSANLGGAAPNAGAGATDPNQPGQAPGEAGGTGDDNSPPGVANTAAGAAANGGPGAPGTATNAGSSGPTNQVFGGGPIVGVASTSKEKTIRLFNKKDHYYQWQFIYDPTMDQGGLLSTPNQPSLAGLNGQQAGATNPGAQQGLPVPGGVTNQPNQPGTSGSSNPGSLTPPTPPDQNQSQQ